MHSAARSLWRQPLLSPFLWGDCHFLPVFVFQVLCFMGSTIFTGFGIFPAFFFLLSEWTCVCSWGGVSDIPGQFGSPAVLLGVFSQLPGSFLIGVSHFSDSG